MALALALAFDLDLDLDWDWDLDLNLDLDLDLAVALGWPGSPAESCLGDRSSKPFCVWQSLAYQNFVVCGKALLMITFLGVAKPCLSAAVGLEGF